MNDAFRGKDNIIVQFYPPARTMKHQAHLTSSVHAAPRPTCTAIFSTSGWGQKKADERCTNCWPRRLSGEPQVTLSSNNSCECSWSQAHTPRSSQSQCSGLPVTEKGGRQRQRRALQDAGAGSNRAAHLMLELSGALTGSSHGSTDSHCSMSWPLKFRFNPASLQHFSGISGSIHQQPQGYPSTLRQNMNLMFYLFRKYTLADHVTYNICFLMSI